MPMRKATRRLLSRQRGYTEPSQDAANVAAEAVVDNVPACFLGLSCSFHVPENVVTLAQRMLTKQEQNFCAKLRMEKKPTGRYTEDEGNNKKRKREGEMTETINLEDLPKSNEYKMNATNVRPEWISLPPFLTAYNPDAMFEPRTNSRGPIDSEALINAQKQGQI